MIEKKKLDERLKSNEYESNEEVEKFLEEK